MCETPVYLWVRNGQRERWITTPDVVDHYYLDVRSVHRRYVFRHLFSRFVPIPEVSVVLVYSSACTPQKQTYLEGE